MEPLEPIMPAMPPELEKIISTGGEKIESMSPEMEKHILEMSAYNHAVWTKEIRKHEAAISDIEGQIREYEQEIQEHLRVGEYPLVLQRQNYIRESHRFIQQYREIIAKLESKCLESEAIRLPKCWKVFKKIIAEKKSFVRHTMEGDVHIFTFEPTEDWVAKHGAEVDEETLSKDEILKSILSKTGDSPDKSTL